MSNDDNEISARYVNQRQRYLLIVSVFAVFLMILNANNVQWCTISNKTEIETTPHEGLLAIVTGLEHSGTTLIGSVLFNAPCVIGAFETGYLAAETPSVIDKVEPWYHWNMARTNVTDLSYRLTDDDIEAMKKAPDFIQMYDILRHRSYLFNNLNDEEYCEKPYNMIDKTPLYVRPSYFESILEKSPGVPVIVLKKKFDNLKDSWDARNDTLTQQFYDEVFDNVWNMKVKYKGRILIIHSEDIMTHPEATMIDIFEHIGLEFKTEYLQMKGLLKKFMNDTRTIKRIEQLKFKAGKHSYDRQVVKN